MSHTEGKLTYAPSAESSQPHFLNPFTGVIEPFFSEGQANSSMLKAAAKRISDLEEEVRAIKAHLVL